jgi:hypothetical protein
MKLSIITLILAISTFVLTVLIIIFVCIPLPKILEKRVHHPTTHALSPVTVCSTGPVDLRERPWPIIDNVPLQPGDRVLLRHQLDARLNGIWIVPLTYEEDWSRAPDLAHKSQLIDGVMVFVLKGEQGHHHTYVLRILGNHRHVKNVGEEYIYFLPLLEHLFGTDHLHTQVIQVDSEGRPSWYPSEDVCQQIIQMLKVQGWLGKEEGVLPKIPPILHFIHGFWDQQMTASQRACISAWTQQNPYYQVVCWNVHQCEDLMKNKYTEWWHTYWKFHLPVMRLDFVKWFILYDVGGYYIDLDCIPVKPISVEGRLALPRNEKGVHTYFVAAAKHHPFIRFVWQALKPAQTTQVAQQTGHVAISKVYSDVGADFKDVVVQDLDFCQHQATQSWSVYV